MQLLGKVFDIGKGFVHRILVIVGAVGLTFLCFMVLPIIQSINQRDTADLTLQTVDSAVLEPPPPPPEEEPEEEEEEPEEEPPPELTEETPPLDLSQLELALNTGVGDGFLGGDYAIDLGNVVKSGDDVDSLFNLSDLDQKPRAIYQPGPQITPQIRKRAPGKVYIIFIVNKDGRVENPLIQRSSDPVFEKAALDAVKKWKFEPGKSGGKSVRFRMRVPITFPEGL